MVRAQTSRLSNVAGAVLFVVLATANAAGYRYGVSDQAFYIPAILDDIRPALFPRDTALIESQARLMVLDEVLAAIVRATGVPLEALFLAAYLLSLLLLYAALHAIGTSLYASRWTAAGMMLAFTLRHRIPKTSANSFEPYFHPRMLAFAVGALAIAVLLARSAKALRRGDRNVGHPGRSSAAALVLTAASMLVHPTTGMFFGIIVGTAVIVSDRRLRPWLLTGAALAAGVGTWALAAGPLSARMVVMDDVWRQALAGKDSVFPGTWPVWAWLANVALYAIWAWAYVQRRDARRATAIDTGLFAGGGALLALFLITLPMVERGVAFFVQLQVSRVFWLLDFLALVYVFSALELLTAKKPRIVTAVAAALLALAAGRGTYILAVEHPERSLFEVTVPPSPWLSVMQWLEQQPPDVHVLADPGHAWKYGTSVRVAGARDVFLEDVKDSAVAMYSRDVAVRVVERIHAVGDFTQLTADRARALDARYGLDFLVTTASLDLPVAYARAPFTVYSLR
jgi:hypothetical protein